MRKALFIDRDGTLVMEPPLDYQLDSFEKLGFYPQVFSYLSRIAEELDFELVMVSNQDGLGTSSFPEEDFWPVHKFILKSFENEGVVFDDILIDRSMPVENSPFRKPGTAMFTKYLSGEYDLNNSYVIGDRATDMELAMNLGAKGIFIEKDNGPDNNLDIIVLATNSWKDIYIFLKLKERRTNITRLTRETNINLDLNLDGSGKSSISTGIAFFDHMLDQLARHGRLDLVLEVKGDLEVDEHHTIEDVAIVLGEAFSRTLGDKLGIERYGFSLPMDDCLAQVAIDFGGRNWLVWKADFNREMIGSMPTEMFFHFFKSFSDSAKCNLNIKAEGENEHHKIEAIFKAFAKAIKAAIKRDLDYMQLPSTKGSL